MCCMENVCLCVCVLILGSGVQSKTTSGGGIAQMRLGTKRGSTNQLDLGYDDGEGETIYAEIIGPETIAFQWEDNPCGSFKYPFRIQDDWLLQCEKKDYVNVEATFSSYSLGISLCFTFFFFLFLLFIFRF